MATTGTKRKSVTRRRVATRPRATAPAKWKFRRAGGLKILQAPAPARLPWLIHGFSTRPGGESKLEAVREGKKGSERVLNLGFTDWDLRDSVLANRLKFTRAIGREKMRVVVLRQIHSDIIHRVDSSPASSHETPLQGDALLTRQPGILLAVQTADCIPILLADAKHRAVAAVHAGWRGTIRRITEKTLGRMHMEFGTQPQDVIAALGPGIGRCCYEVGPDVVKEFAGQFPAARDWFDGPFDALTSDDPRDADPNWLPWLTMKPPGHASPPPRVQLDLIAANRAILVGAGVAPENISSSSYCTACRTDLFFSYRRERATGRMMAVIGIKP